MQLQHKKLKLSQHSIAILISVLIVVLLNVAWLLFYYLPTEQTRDDLVIEQQQLMRDVDALKQQILTFEAHVDELNEVMSSESELHQLFQQPWDRSMWKSEFGLYLAAAELSYDVIFTDVVYTDGNREEDIEHNKASLSFIVGGSLANIAAAIDHLYDIPALFELMSWDLSAQQLTVAPRLSEDTPYVLRGQGVITFIN